MFRGDWNPKWCRARIIPDVEGTEGTSDGKRYEDGGGQDRSHPSSLPGVEPDREPGQTGDGSVGHKGNDENRVLQAQLMEGSELGDGRHQNPHERQGGLPRVEEGGEREGAEEEGEEDDFAGDVVQESR